MNNYKQTHQNEEMDELKTGTTTIGLTTEDGAIMAADKRASMGHLTSTKNAQKIYKLDEKIGLTIAGSVGDAQKIVRIMRSQLKLHKLETKELSLKGAGTMLSNILHGNKMMPFMNQFLLGGIDKDEEGAIYSLDPAGGLMKHERYTATGSGSQMAFGVLEDRYEEKMDHQEAKELAINAVRSAIERDTASGNGIMVAEVTKENGYQVISDQEIESTLQ